MQYINSRQWNTLEYTNFFMEYFLTTSHIFLLRQAERMITVMEQHHSDIQKRREKRLLELRKLSRIPYPKNRAFPSEDIDEQYKTRSLIKVLASILIVIAVYLVFQTNHPYADGAQKYIKEALTREFNFNGLYSWYQDKFAGNPAILPTFTIKEKENTNDFSFTSPISGIPLGIELTESGVYLETTSFEPIMAVEKGLVKYIGEQEKMGRIVIIKHQNGFESTYALLSRVDVQQDEWIESGKILGAVEQKLYFAIKNQEKYLNPMEVIPFD